jgi:ribonucleotide monophosphatase NagD (HAD superfamily)
MQTPEGLSLGPGCFVTGLEYSADIKAEVVGKPQASFFSMALEKLNSKLSIKLDPKGKLKCCHIIFW